MTEERFNELKAQGYFADSESYEKDGSYFTEIVKDGDVYILDKRTYDNSDAPVNEGYD